MKTQLKGKELTALIQNVFSIAPNDKRLAVLVDVPDKAAPDHSAWRTRRAMAAEWVRELNKTKSSLGLQSMDLIVYPNVHSNNADLPETAYTTEIPPEILNAEILQRQGKAHSFTQVLSEHQIILAPTEFSATAPLKLAAQKFGFRAATMPGFSQAMIPALRLDYEKINQRVWAIKNKLDPAIGMDIRFSVAKDRIYSVHFDLRFRTAHVSSGRFPEPGTAGNLPSGECYIVPYEGEKGEPTRSEGMLPVQFQKEIVLYRIKNNRAVDVTTQGAISKDEREKLFKEPAYGNIAEIGFGVLKDFGLKPVGEILLDEKLGLHIAFGRSDHFGGAVGIKDFTSPDNVVHIDRIYIPEMQRRIRVVHVTLGFEDGTSFSLMQDGEYTLFT